MTKDTDFSSGATIHNVKLDKHFTVTANSTPADPNLSWEAKGLLWYILSRDENWRVYVKQLVTIYSGEKKRGHKRDAIRDILTELKQAGYVTYTKTKDARGRWQHRYDVYPMPVQNFQKNYPQQPPPQKTNSTDQDFQKVTIQKPAAPQGKPKNFQKMFPEPELPAPELPAPAIPAFYQEQTKPRTDRTKKEIKESIEPAVVPCAPAEESLVSIVPPSASAAQGSIPSYKEDFSIDYSSPELLQLLEMEPQTQPFFRTEIVGRWIHKYGAPTVLETMKFFFHVKATQKKPIPKPEAWMETALKNKYSQVDKNYRQNKAFAENLKRKYHLVRLKVNKRYCQDTQTGKDYYYHLPATAFQEYLKQLIE